MSIIQIPLTRTHRVVYVWYLAAVEPGSQFGVDNLYTSIEFLHMMQRNETYLITMPFDGTPDSAKTIEFAFGGAIHIVGTLRGNYGAIGARRRLICGAEK